MTTDTERAACVGIYMGFEGQVDCKSKKARSVELPFVDTIGNRPCIETAWLCRRCERLCRLNPLTCGPRKSVKRIAAIVGE